MAAPRMAGGAGALRPEAGWAWDISKSRPSLPFPSPVHSTKGCARCICASFSHRHLLQPSSRRLPRRRRPQHPRRRCRRRRRAMIRTSRPSSVHSTSTEFGDPFAAKLRPPPGESEEQRQARLQQEAEAKRVSDDIDEELKQDARRLQKRKQDVKVRLRCSTPTPCSSSRQLAGMCGVAAVSCALGISTRSAHFHAQGPMTGLCH